MWFLAGSIEMQIQKILGARNEHRQTEKQMQEIPSQKPFLNSELLGAFLNTRSQGC
jgi:hypothetical protein